MSLFRKILYIGILMTSIFLAVQLIQGKRMQTQMKNDLVELSNIKYGIFSIDEWKEIFADIISKKIDGFDLEQSSRAELHAKISNFLNQVIDDFESRFYQEKGKSVFGIIQTGVAYLTGTMKQIKKDIPIITDQVIDFLNEEENRENIKVFLIEKLDQYSDQTFEGTDYTLVNQILDRYDQNSAKEAKIELNRRIIQSQEGMQTSIYIIIALVIFAFILLLLSRQLDAYEFMWICLICFVYLALGVILPMIEIDARISEMNFYFMGETITFQDQILYYRSKSILELVTIMFEQERIDLIFVGILVLSFSVIFPILKLLSTLLYLFTEKLKSNKIIQFLIFKMGKWSMADVMVIAIFMAYIGFDGIISEQLKQVESLTQRIELFTTNYTTLLFGFYAFASFVLLSLLASHKLQLSTKKKDFS